MLTAIFVLLLILFWVALSVKSDVDETKSHVAMIRYKLEELEGQVARNDELMITVQKTANRALGRLEDRLGTRPPPEDLDI